jgi:uncharacterized membrane protein YhdT
LAADSYSTAFLSSSSQVFSMGTIFMAGFIITALLQDSQSGDSRFCFWRVGCFALPLVSFLSEAIRFPLHRLRGSKPQKMSRRDAVASCRSSLASSLI